MQRSRSGVGVLPRALSGALAAALVGCAGYREREADRAFQAGEANVERVEVMIQQSVTNQASATLYGTHPDACTRIDHIDTRRHGSVIEVSVLTRRESNADCPAEEVPFERTWFFHVGDLPPGFYTLDVNGATASFNVQPDPSWGDPYMNPSRW